MVNFEIYDAIAWLIDMQYTLPNISRSKGNQTMKFGQLLKYNRNIFVEKSYTKCGGKTSARPFSKNQISEQISEQMSRSLDQ